MFPALFDVGVSLTYASGLRVTFTMSQYPRFGKYVLLNRIAAGGMAELFLAHREGAADGTDKQVAIKRILPHLAHDEEFIELFLNEARLASLLNHASLVRVYDLGRIDGVLFLVMEYVDGRNLRQIARALRQVDRVMDPRFAAAICARVAEGLDYAHRLTAPTGGPLGLVHRDISPDNILLSRDGYVKIADFGIAKAFAHNSFTLRPGQIRGKVAFMSPEQVRGHGLDGRSDLFSLGVVLYALSTGHSAFGADDEMAVLQSVLRRQPVAPSTLVPRYPAALERIIDQLLAKDRSGRPPDAAAVAVALDAFVRESGPPIGARETAAFLEGLEAEHRKPAEPEGRAPTLDDLPAFRDTRQQREPVVDKTVTVPVTVGPGRRDSSDDLVLTDVLDGSRGESSSDSGDFEQTGPTPRVGEQVTRELPRMAVGVSLTSTPTATVYLASRRLGDTPLSVTLGAGRTRLLFENPVLGLHRTVVLTVDPSNPSVNVTFGFGLLELEAPDGCGVYIDEKRAGKTPLRPVKLYEGEHQLDVVHPGTGIRASMVIQVGLGQTLKCRVGGS